MRAAVIVIGLICACAASPLASSAQDLSADNAWKDRVAAEVDKIMHAHSDLSSVLEEQAQAQVEWTAAAAAPAPEQERARPPKLDDVIGNLRALSDKIELENVNAVANQDATSSSFAAKKAKIESMLAGPQQAVINRGEQRALCEREVGSIQQLKDVVAKAVERGHVIAEMRREQSKHYTEMTMTVKRLTQKNVDTLTEVKSLLSQEIVAEKDINGAVHFDPVALRQQQSEDMLRHAQELTGNLMSLLQSKVKNHEDALEKIKQAFACPKCEEEAKNLEDAASQLTTLLKETKEKCSVMAESHRALDQADREKVLSLKRDLEDVETAERVHQLAEEALQQERKVAAHTAQKMLGFFQNIPRTTTPSA